MSIHKKVEAYDEIVICIDPGHGGTITGEIDDTNGGAMYHDLIEKDVNLATAKALRDELLEYGNVRVYLTRETDTALTLEERVNYAASVNADYLISIHYNASSDHNFFGSEIFTSAFGEMYAKGHALAKSIMKEWVAFGNTEKDIKTRIGNAGTDYYGIIRHGTEVSIPTIILEHAYLDNDKDYLRIKDASAWEELGKCDARGIAEYFDLEKNVVKNQIGPKSEPEIPTEPVMPDDTPPEEVSLTVNKYNSKTGKVDFSITASDPESKLMYYGFHEGDVNDDTVFSKLELWEGSKGQMKGSTQVTPGFEGSLTATVFNVYQLDTRSNSVTLSIENSVTEEEEIEEADSDTSSGEIGADKKEDTLKEQNADGDKTRVVNEIKLSEPGSKDDKELDKAMAKAIDEEDGSVEEAYKKLLMVGLFGAVIFVVSMVLLAYSSSRRRKKRRRRQMRERMEETGYDWNYRK